MPANIIPPLLYEVSLHGEGCYNGVLGINGSNKKVNVSLPRKFGGKGNTWSAEHLFLSAISCSFMAAYLQFAKQVQVKISRLECTGIGQIEIINGRYKFTNINLYPKIFITDNQHWQKANLALKKTHQNCLVTNSVDAIVYYHSEIVPLVVDTTVDNPVV